MMWQNSFKDEIQKIAVAAWVKPVAIGAGVASIAALAGAVGGATLKHLTAKDVESDMDIYVPSKTLKQMEKTIATEKKKSKVAQKPYLYGFPTLGIAPGYVASRISETAAEKAIRTNTEVRRAATAAKQRREAAQTVADEIRFLRFRGE